MKILNTRQFIEEKMKIMPITNAELDAVQKKVDEPSIKIDSQKTYYTVTSNNKYTAKWWVKYSDENGEIKSKGFPIKRERDSFISELEEQGYVCDKKKCS